MKLSRIAAVALLGVVPIPMVGCNSGGAHLDGTYWVPSAWPSRHLIFEGDTLKDLSVNNPRVYEYSIPGGIESGTSILLTDTSTNKTTTCSFDYNGDCITLDKLIACKQDSGNGHNENVAETTAIYVYYNSTICCQVFVILTPSDKAEAGKTYSVYLYNKGVLRGSSSVEWNQPQINLRESKEVIFDVLTAEEIDAYSCVYPPDCDLRDLFSVDLYD